MAAVPKDEERSVSDTAEEATFALVEDLEEMIQGQRELALVFCFSALAAAAIILNRYDICRKTHREFFDENWQNLISDDQK